MRKIIPPLLLVAAALGRAHAVEPFRVEDIRVEGLQRVPVGTVFNYLPVRVGESVDDAQIAEAVRSLYKTGFFQDVAVEREGNVLIVNVQERPSIATVDVRGNDEISDEDLKKALKSVGLTEGQVFNRFLLNDVEKELRQLYQARGRYDTKISSTVSPLPRNRVGVRIDIDESEPARIQEINIVGNERFSDRELRKLLEVGPKSWYHLFSDRDMYAREKLAADLEKLRSFYQNQGYVNFAITSTQVAVSPDRQGIFITINVSEGESYRVGEVALAGDLAVEEEVLRKLVRTNPGELYSREEVTASVRRIRDRLGEEGYAFANVNVVPKIDEQQKTVGLTYFVDPGKRVYVRRINIRGNERTRDEVIRRELRQMEGAWLSSAAVKRSRSRLQRLGFFEDVNVETPPVPGEADQVDLNVNVKERLSGTLQAGLGYGQEQGVILNLSVQQDNFLGTGDRLYTTLNNSRVNTEYSVSFLDRYFTKWGISRTLTASYKLTDADNANLGEYNSDTLKLGVSFGIPLGEEDSFNFGLTAERLGVELRAKGAADESSDPDPEDLPCNGTVDDAPSRMCEFIGNPEGEASYTNLKATLGWQRDSRDNAIFPTEGSQQRLGAEITLPGSDLEYYKISYKHTKYFPLTKKVVLSLEGSLGYGDGYGKLDKLPFFENFYAGGISTIRGFKGNTVGPKDENGDPIGGNARVLGSAQLIFPVPFVDIESLRLATFMDAGNVWNTGTGSGFDDLRYSVGVGLVWLSPLGALTMSFARPLNDRAGDETEAFQFSLGTTF